jgi:hypothetical protein
MSILLILRILLRYDIIFIANKTLAGKTIQCNTIQHLEKTEKTIKNGQSRDIDSEPIPYFLMLNV